MYFIGSWKGSLCWIIQLFLLRPFLLLMTKDLPAWPQPALDLSIKRQALKPIFLPKHVISHRKWDDLTWSSINTSVNFVGLRTTRSETRADQSAYAYAFTFPLSPRSKIKNRAYLDQLLLPQSKHGRLKKRSNSWTREAAAAFRLKTTTKKISNQRDF